MKLVATLLIGVFALACGYHGIEYKNNKEPDNHRTIKLEKENR